MGEETEPQIRQDLLTAAQANRMVAEARLKEGDWAGMPFPVLGLNLVLEPRYKHQDLSNFQWEEYYDEHGVRHVIEKEPPPEPSEFKFVNSWWCDKHQATIRVVKDKQGRAQARLSPESRLSFALRTLDAASVWPIEAEQKAQQKLASLIPEHQFYLYLLTGHFSEVSRRSQVTYVFRRGRPTLALRQSEAEDWTHVLCALCLHPIGYYDKTWAGVMCPTDEVIAHLLMMRGSEEKYWANANQHPLDHPAAGV
jgi:hypothetical protein